MISLPGRRRVLLVLVATLVALAAGCSDDGPTSGTDAGAGGAGASADDGGATEEAATGGAPTTEPRTEHVEATLWISPDRSLAVVRTVIEDPIPTAASSLQLSGEVLRLATDRTLLVDGEPRPLEGTGLVPWDFEADRRLELELAFPVTPSTRWQLDGQMLDNWLPMRSDVPRYFSRVVWEVEVHGPVEARIGGDPGTCERAVPGGGTAASCAATDETGLPPLIYLPGDDETVRRSAGGYVELIGDLDPAVADDLLAFSDGAVASLNAILGDVAPRRVEVVIGDVVGNFAGEALGPMVVLDAEYVRRQPDQTRDLLAHELVHTAQEHRLAAPGRDPGSGMTESLAEYLGSRLRHGDDLDAIRDRVRNRGVANADVGDVEGLAPRFAFGRRPPVGEDELLATYEYERRALVYGYLPRAWVDLHELLGTEQMDAFLRALHTRAGLDWNIDQVFELAGEIDAGAQELLSGYWEDPVAADQEDW